MASTYEKIATTTLSSTTNTVTFSSISGAYTDLVLIINGKSDAEASPVLQFNSDTGNNYSDTYMSGRSTNATASVRDTSQPYIWLVAYSRLNTSNLNLLSIINVMNYSNSTTYKTVLTRSGNAVQGNVDTGVGLWRNTNAITSISVKTASNNFVSGSTFTLYGILKA